MTAKTRAAIVRREQRDLPFGVVSRTPGGLAIRDAVLDDLRARRFHLLHALNARLVELARTRPTRTVSGDDAMWIIRDWPEAVGLDPRWTGAVWRMGPWRKTGQYVPSLRRENHARPIALWVLHE